MQQDQLKHAVARAAINYIQPKLSSSMILGIGTGSTANFFIDELSQLKDHFYATVASSEASEQRLQDHGIKVLDLNSVDEIAIYVDGADESNHQLELIKGGGAALTREKIVTEAADEFVCIADESKLVSTLGQFPLPVEVIPMASKLVANKITQLGGAPVLREGVITDNGNHILDVHDLSISAATDLETQLNQIPGVVTNGLFALKPADILLLGTSTGVRSLTKASS